MSEPKPILAKPVFYATCFQRLKEIAYDHGYNLLISGSLHRDFDLVAIPWAPEIKPAIDMINAFVDYLGGHIMPDSEERREMLKKMRHGRDNYIINLNRGGKSTNYEDPQYYLDISITPAIRY